MPEKITIAEIDIDMEKALSDAVEMRKRVETLQNLMKEAEKTTGKTSAEYVQYSTALKAASAQLRSHENMMVKTIETETAEKGSLEQLRAKLAVVSKEWAKLSEIERLNTVRGKELTAQKLALTNQLKKEEAATGDARRNVGNYQSALEGLPGPIGRATSQMKGLITTIGKLGPVGAVIAVAITAIAAPLVAFFKKTEKGFELMERKVAGFKAAWNVLVGEVISGGEKMVDAVDKGEKKMNLLAQVVMGIGTALKNANIIAFAVEMDAAATAAENYTRELQELEDLQRGMIVSRAETNRQIAESKLLYEDETKSVEERMSGLKQSMDLEIQMTEAEVKHQKAVVAQIQAVNEEKKKAGQLRDADLLKLEEAKAKEIDLETESLIKQRKLQSTINKAYDQLEVEQKKINAEAAVEAMRVELEAFVKTLQEKEAVQTDLLQNKLPALDADYQARRIEAMKINWDNEQILLEQALETQFSTQQQALDRSKQAELANAEKTGANKVLIEKKYAKAEAAINRAKANATLSVAQSVADAVAQLAGESTAIGKAAAIASVTIDTYQSAEAAFSGMVDAFPGPWGIALGVVAAAAAVAVGVANVQKILAVKTDLSSGSSGGGGISTGTATAAPVGSAMTQTQTSVGQGIVNRETVTNQGQENQVQIVLPVDSVTEKQMDADQKKKTSTI